MARVVFLALARGSAVIGAAARGEDFCLSCWLWDGDKDRKGQGGQKGEAELRGCQANCLEPVWTRMGAAVSPHPAGLGAFSGRMGSGSRPCLHYLACPCPPAC
ncbi:hypothetical protein NDU88_003031 [Pleurodeles waltl]|uniref:Secreted protein n=1 Tax=Pleurodeles waltl TaxID=8319 RepID=A0AAV7UEM6_PLEWA|nr:hypothetical protein NDU88_003031 [Pleurodeles waltl]